nr:hypothetical protein CFP56_03599 [Quercus suber]
MGLSCFGDGSNVAERSETNLSNQFLSVLLCLLASVFKCKNKLKLRVQEHFASVPETFRTRFSVNFDSGFISG